MPFLDTTGHAIHSSHISETVNHLESIIFDPSTNRVKELHLVMLLPTEANAGLHFLDNNGQRTFSFFFYPREAGSLLTLGER